MSISPLGDPGLIQLPSGEEITTFSGTGACTVTNGLVQKVVDLYCSVLRSVKPASKYVAI